MTSSMFRAGQIYLVDHPLRWNDPVSWFAKWTKWMSQDKGEEPTRNLWHCGLLVDSYSVVEIANASFDALRLKPLDYVLRIRDKNVVIYDLPLSERERKVVAETALNTYMSGNVPFNHLCVVGLTLANLGNKTGLWPHWGWPERHIRYGFFCCEFVAYCFSKIGLYFRPRMNWWQGTTNDDIDDYCRRHAEAIYEYWVTP